MPVVLAVVVHRPSAVAVEAVLGHHRRSVVVVVGAVLRHSQAEEEEAVREPVVNHRRSWVVGAVRKWCSVTVAVSCRSRDAVPGHRRSDRRDSADR